MEHEHGVVRRWTARATPEGARGYARWFAESLAPALAAIAGHRGALVAVRHVGDEVEIAVETRWASMDAVRGFAGDTIDRAVVEPEARAFLRSFDDGVTHAEVLVDTTREL